MHPKQTIIDINYKTMRKYLSTLLVASVLIASCSKEAEVIREKIVSQSRPILSGQGQPDNGKGEDGDYYLDLTNAKLYGPKTQGAWGEPSLDLKGLPGKDGKDGKDGQNGQDGQPGRDGQNGTNGESPRIGDNGNWWVGNTDLGVKAQGTPGQNGRDGQNGTNGRDGQNGTNGRDGQNGLTPRIGENGNWWVGDTDLGVKAQGNPGENGRDGQNGTNGRDGQNGTNGQDGQPGRDGQNGLTPRIGDNGNWWIGDEDTGKPARGAQGERGIPGVNGRDGNNGFTPYIGPNGNWWVDNRDTGKPARGEQGRDGAAGQNGQNGQNGVDGSKILAESRAPQATDGVKGDYFIDKAAKIFYGPKTASGWPSTGISLTGNPVVTEDYRLSPDGKTLEKWLNKKTRYIDMNADPKLSEVEKIANNAFDDREADYDLSTIIVGDKVTELGIFTFSKCTRLRRIELPDGLITIGKGAFDACFNLQYINIPETVTNLGEQAFTNCTKLKTITIPKGISSFGKRTFAGCTALRTLTLENPVGFEINKAGIQAAFQGVTLNVIYVPYGSADSYKSKNKSSYSNYESIIKSIVIQ